jgi:TonB family protein
MMRIRISQEKHEAFSDFCAAAALSVITLALIFALQNKEALTAGLRASSEILIEYSAQSEMSEESMESEISFSEESIPEPVEVKREPLKPKPEKQKKEKEESSLSASEKQVLGDSAVSGVENSQSELDEFINSFLLLVQKHLYYPKNARKAGISGTVEIKIFFDAGGEIENFEIAGGNRRKILAEAALKTLETVKSDWRPQGLVKKQAIVVPVYFELK